MSRKDAPNYRFHDCCFHCQNAYIGQNGIDRCEKWDFQFDVGNKLAPLTHGAEANFRVCNDFKRWNYEPK